MYVTFQLVFLLREMSSYIQQKITILPKTTDILSAQKHKNTALSILKSAMLDCKSGKTPCGTSHTYRKKVKPTRMT